MKLKHLCIAFAVLMVAGCGGPPKITDTAVPWTNLAITHACSVDLDVPADKFTVQNFCPVHAPFQAGSDDREYYGHQQRAENGFLCFHAAACEYLANQPHGVSPLGCDIG